jgi:hypothetical protein
VQAVHFRLCDGDELRIAGATVVARIDIKKISCDRIRTEGIDANAAPAVKPCPNYMCHRQTPADVLDRSLGIAVV